MARYIYITFNKSNKMCEEFLNKLKLFIKNITDPDLHAELWDELGPI